jgi:hypothetical protein
MAAAGIERIFRVPDAVQRPISAFTRVFDALWHCSAEPGPMVQTLMDPGLHVGSAFWIRRRRRDLVTPEGHLRPR